MRDSDIRLTLSEHLHGAHAGDDSLIIEELGLCTGSARVDVAVINSAITGYEIKSDRDTLTRLPGQLEIYSRTLDYVTMVASVAHVEKIIMLAPEWFGVMEAREEDDGVTLQAIRPGRKNPGVDPYALVQLLWREEALNLLIECGLERGVRSKPRAEIWKRLSQSKPIEELGRIVRHQLRVRKNWREQPQGAKIL